MYRLNRKTNLEFINENELFENFDDLMKSSYRLTDEEYSFIKDKVTEKDISILFKGKQSFSDKRKTINVLSKYIYKIN